MLRSETDHRQVFQYFKVLKKGKLCEFLLRDLTNDVRMVYKEYTTINLSYSMLCRVKLKGFLPGYTG